MSLSALQAWPDLAPQPAVPLSGGLINQTWRLGDPPVAVLQRVNPIFGPEVHVDIEAVTAHLASKGLGTPRLVATALGGLCHTDDAGAVWRVLTWAPGETLHQLEGPGSAAAAGRFVARWHAAAADLDHRFVHKRLGVHDTRAHMSHLAAGLVTQYGHRLFDQVEPLACDVLAAWADWQGELGLPERVCHGDLKVSNLRFGPGGEATCLVDLDTLGRMPIDAEMGDAWRSWCNRSGEDADEVRFDLALFEASAGAYLAASDLTPEERDALPGGIERICLELAARFAVDALEESYFGWDPAVAPTRGDHNLLRGRGQLRLAQSVRAQRAAMEAILGAWP